MNKEPLEPGPGRSTANAAFVALTKHIAQRNEQMQQEARKLRTAREMEIVRRRHQDVERDRMERGRRRGEVDEDTLSMVCAATGTGIMRRFAESSNGLAPSSAAVTAAVSPAAPVPNTMTS